VVANEEKKKRSEEREGKEGKLVSWARKGFGIRRKERRKKN